MFAVLHCAFARSRFHALALALCVAAPVAFASGVLPLEQRIAEIRELNRFVPERALPKLEALEAEARNAPLAQRIEFLNQLAMARHGLGHHGQSFTLANELIALGREYDHAGALAKGFLMQGYSAFAQHRPSEAHRLVWEAEKLANTTDDIDLRVRAAISSGESHAEEGNLPSALERLQSAAALARRQGDPVHVVMALNSLVRLYSQMREPEKGFGLLDEAFAAARKANSPGRMATIRNAEYWLAIDTGQRERALRALQEGLALERSIGATKRIAVSLINLSDFYLKTGAYRQAAGYAEQAVAATRPLNDRKLDATAHLNLGQAYLGTGRLADGKRQIELGMAGYEEIGDKPELQNALVEYGLALERVGDLPGALQAYHRERKISNELFERRRQQAMLDLQEKYEGDKKQRQIELLRSENLIKSTEIDNRRLQQRVWWLLVAVFALTATVVGLLYRKVRHANAQLHEKNRELKQQSVRDPLTGLYNRRHFLEYMRALPATGVEANEQSDEQTSGGALFLLDVDHFKNINDTYGHAAGDVVLTTIAARLCEILRETDMIVRWGGEEFLAYLPTAPAGTSGLDEVAGRILAGIGATVVDHGGTALSVNVSIGYAPFPLSVGKQNLAWERVVNLVDMALYLAKSHGRNRAYGVRGFADDRLASIDAIEQNLEHAWRAGQVDLSVVMGEREPLKAANG
ncbi:MULTISPECIES: GGDEF domain-containing protein [Massilia]|uniref:diguanylate cyclase n=1 Tax=Massilia aurea TaxID=373040 RepID=A0A422QLQ9_9BURK|nr:MULTISPECIES: GGDEF domain-containing protein [Massilia]MDY0962309.1 diguanylate cyclase [Massilia sp. CFBP9026]RNF30863.1 diguanylate cyclase [Massilia aurea]